MMCRFILDMVLNFKIFGKVKIQHDRQNVINLFIVKEICEKVGANSTKLCTNVQNNTLNIFRYCTIINFNPVATVAKQHFFLSNQHVNLL